ncbi:MAG: oligosaccharide flippase family protein, partial [Bacteroidota bacterium]
MSLKKQAIKAAIWEFFGKISGNILSFGFSVILARLLEPGEFGTIAIITGIINIASHFWDVGLGSSLIQRKEINNLHYSSVQIFNLAIGFVMFVLFYLSAPYIAKFYQKPELVNVLKVMSLLFITNSFGNVYRARIRRDLSFSLLTKSALFGVLVGGIICVLMAYNGFGIWSLVAQFLASSIVANLFLHYFFRGQAVKLAFSLSSIKELWDYGFKMFLTGIIDVIMDNLDSLIIGKMFVSRTVGFFYRAKSLNAFVIDYSTAGIMNVYFRIASHYQDNIKALVEIYERLNSIMFFVTNYLVGILFLFNKEIIILVF